MRMRTKLPIVTLVGAGALLLAALAVIFTLRAQTAYAQNGPTVEIDLNSYKGITKQGQSVARYTFKNFQDITCEKNAQNQHQHHTAFDDPCYHRSEVYERDPTTNNVDFTKNFAHECGLGGNRSFSKGAGISKVIHYGQNRISSNCPVGEYTLKVILMGSAREEDAVAFLTEDFEVKPPPTATFTPTPTKTSTPTSTPTKKSGSGGGGSGGGGGGSGGGGSGSGGGGGGSGGGGGGSGDGGGGSGDGGGGTPGGGTPPLVPYSPPLQTSQQQTGPVAVTQPEVMNVRSGPGLTYDVVTTVPQNTQARIVGVGPDNEWYQVEIDGVEGQVWIYQGLTTLVGSLAGVKQFTAEEIALLPGGGADGAVPLAITLPITMNVRSGPGLTYDVVRVVPQGTQGRIFGIDPTDDWFQIELEGLDTLAWVYQDLTRVVGSLAAVRRLTTQEIALLPAAITQPLLTNVRSGPGTNYDILTTIPQGTWARITGIDTQAEWFQVELDDLDEPAWVSRELTKVAGGSLAGVIQIAVGDTPAPTAGQLTSSITVELALRQLGGVDLEVSWTDAGPCTQLYNLYHRSGVDTTTYISLETAATATTANSKSLSFNTLSGSSFISAWCGTNSGGREVAEVEIDPGTAGTYSSTRPTSGGVASVAPRADEGTR